MHEEAILGVDIGTSSSKAVLVSPDGRVFATASREHLIERPEPGWAEMDSDLWWAELKFLTQNLTRDFAGVVRAVGVSGMGPCVLLADEDGQALRKAILYGIDTRAELQVEQLTARYTAEAIAARCGSLLSSQAVGPKLKWVRDNEPDVASAARRLFMPSSWLVHKLTGEYVLDRHSASQSVPLYDIESAQWFEPWWSEVAGDIRPPRLLWSGEIAGTISRAAADETRLPVGIPVVAGTIDAWSEALSVNALNAGDLMLMYGSTMFLVHSVDAPLRSPSLWTTAGIFPGTTSLAGGMATSGLLADWLKSLFGLHEYNEVLRAADAAGPGGRGLLMLPYFAGERTPIVDPRARGVLAGLTLSHTRGDIFRASLEATAMGVRHNIEAMEAAGANIKRVVAVGGGTQGHLWTQIVSDVLQRSQELTAHNLGASYGAAFLAAATVGQPSIATWNPVVETVQPNRENADLYDEFYGLYRALYSASRHVVHALAAHQLRASASDVRAESRR